MLPAPEVGDVPRHRSLVEPDKARLYPWVLLLNPAAPASEFAMSVLFAVPADATDGLPLAGMLDAHDELSPPSVPKCDHPAGGIVPVPIPLKFSE